MKRITRKWRNKKIKSLYIYIYIQNQQNRSYSIMSCGFQQSRRRQTRIYDHWRTKEIRFTSGGSLQLCLLTSTLSRNLGQGSRVENKGGTFAVRADRQIVYLYTGNTQRSATDSALSHQRLSDIFIPSIISSLVVIFIILFVIYTIYYYYYLHTVDYRGKRSFFTSSSFPSGPDVVITHAPTRLESS